MSTPPWCLLRPALLYGQFIKRLLNFVVGFKSLSWICRLRPLVEACYPLPFVGWCSALSTLAIWPLIRDPFHRFTRTTRLTLNYFFSSTLTSIVLSCTKYSVAAGDREWWCGSRMPCSQKSNSLHSLLNGSVISYNVCCFHQSLSLLCHRRIRL